MFFRIGSSLPLLWTNLFNQILTKTSPPASHVSPDTFFPPIAIGFGMGIPTRFSFLSISIFRVFLLFGRRLDPPSQIFPPSKDFSVADELPYRLSNPETFLLWEGDSGQLHLLRLAIIVSIFFPSQFTSGVLVRRPRILAIPLTRRTGLTRITGPPPLFSKGRRTLPPLEPGKQV